jgi:hypothetical protein
LVTARLKDTDLAIDLTQQKDVILIRQRLVVQHYFLDCNDFEDA